MSPRVAHGSLDVEIEVQGWEWSLSPHWQMGRKSVAALHHINKAFLKGSPLKKGLAFTPLQVLSVITLQLPHFQWTGPRMGEADPDPSSCFLSLKSSAAKHDHRHESAFFESVTDGSRTFGTFGLPGLDDASQREILREPRLSDFSPRPRKDCELPAAWLGTGRTRAEPPWGFCFSLESVRSTSGYSVSYRQIT